MSFDIEETIQSQYAASPHLKALVTAFWDCLNPAADIQSIYDNMVNLDTAYGFGLDVWGRIVAIGREYASADTTLPYWGYEAPQGVTNDRAKNYGNAPFFKKVTGNVRLSDDAYRLYILMKAMINIGDSSLAMINRVIKMLLPDADIKVIHIDTMVLRLVIQSQIPQTARDMLLNLPWLPAGVGLEIYQVITPTWGLEGSGLETLDNGTFSVNDLSTQQ